MSYTPKHFAKNAALDDEPAALMAEPVSETLEEEADAVQERATHGAALISVLVLVSRLTGFVRTWAQAFAVGATVLASCYSVANNLPTLLYDLVAAGVLTTAFLPVYLSVKKRAGKEGANAYTSNLVSILLLLMGVVTVLGMVFARELIYTQAFSATDEFDLDLSTYFFRFFACEVLLYALSTIFSGILNAERDYFWGAVAPIINNAVTTASFVAYAALAGSNPALGVLILALGNPLGVLVQVLACYFPLRKHGIRLRWRIDLSDPALRETVALGVPAIAVTIANFIAASVQSSVQLGVDASAAAVSSYARLWYTLPYAILTVPITTTLFTELSDAWAAGDRASFSRGVSKGMSQVMFFMIPFAMYLAVFANPLCSIISAGKFDESQLAMTSEYLWGLALTLPVYALGMFLQKACSAMHNMRVVGWSNVVATVIQVAMLLWLTPLFGYWGLFFSASTSLFFFLVMDGAVLVSMRKKLGPLGLRSAVASSVKVTALGLLGSAVGLALLYLLNRYLGDCSGTTVRSAAYCVLAGVPSLVATYGAAALLRMPEAALIQGLARKLLRR